MLTEPQDYTMFAVGYTAGLFMVALIESMWRTHKERKEEQELEGSSTTVAKISQ